MIDHVQAQSANDAWLRALGMVLYRGVMVSPRGATTIELPHLTSIIDMHRPVVTIKERGLNYRFMAAEAYWILSGDDSVAGVVPYNSQLLRFSDNGLNFAGAYGPRIADQLSYALNTLVKDPDSRQAGLTIWVPNPPESRDIPCTVAIWFQLRGGLLNVHVFMRSNDLWLGFPYDVFNFSMLGHLAAGLLRDRGVRCQAGALYHTTVSAHLYDDHIHVARQIYQLGGYPAQATIPVPPNLDPRGLMERLKDLRERGNEHLRWWK